MGKRYYCDYCDRSFKDDPEARKKHLLSLQHIRNRTEHYDRFKDPEVILAEETAKIPCKRYTSHGDCAFGSGCRFSHYTPQMIWELRRYVEWRSNRTVPAISDRSDQEILTEFVEGIVEDESTKSVFRADWSLPMELQNYPNLPPSLWPITPETIVDSNFAEWGRPSQP